MFCIITDCDRLAKTRGMCGKHYQQQWRHEQVQAANPLPEPPPEPVMTATAACADLPDNELERIFWPVGYENEGFDRWDEARDVCHQCGIQTACFTYALERRETKADTGIYAGTTPQQRATILKHRRKAA